MGDVQNKYDPRHPHERDGRNIPPTLDPEGRCLVCAIEVELQEVTADRDRLYAALHELDVMNPADFTGNQSHLTPAFREPDFREAFRFVCRVVNGVLHGTDENGRPIQQEEPA